MSPRWWGRRPHTPRGHPMLRYILSAVAAAVLLIPAARAGDDDAKAKKKNKKGPDTEAIFAKLDENKDGKLSPAEFTKITDEIMKKKEGADPKKAAKAGGKRATELFTKLDTDKNGFLSKEEVGKLPE